MIGTNNLAPRVKGGKNIMKINYKETTSFKIDTHFCVWAVCYDIEGGPVYGFNHEIIDTLEDNTRIFSVFTYREEAEDYIRFHIPSETIVKFYVSKISI